MVSLFPHPASFRFHLTVDTLAFGYILPTTGRIRDFHPLETCAAGRTFPARRFVLGAGVFEVIPLAADLLHAGDHGSAGLEVIALPADSSAVL